MFSLEKFKNVKPIRTLTGHYVMFLTVYDTPGGGCRWIRNEQEKWYKVIFLETVFREYLGGYRMIMDYFPFDK